MSQPSSKTSFNQSLVFAALVSLFAVVLLGALTKPTSARKTSIAAMPNLQGAAATEHLKQQGIYASLGEAMTAARYAVYESTSSDTVAYRYYANNPAQQMQACFTAEGVSLHSASATKDSWQLGLKLRSAGYGARQATVAPGNLTTQGNRIEYARPFQSALSYSQPAITEWYVNKTEGLEQGFTLTEPPGERRANERLRLMLQVDDGWQMRTVEDGRAVELRRNQSGAALRYDKLKVQDAIGCELPARMQTQGRELWLEVEETDAVYPVMIDPLISQQAYLKASIPGENDVFGFSVAISGDTAVVGAYSEDSAATGINGDAANNLADGAGAAYVFVYNGVSWSQQAYLKASNADSGDTFGFSVAISGDTIVVGARDERSVATGVNGNQGDNQAFQAGAAYVFVRSGTTWSQQAYLKSSNTTVYDQFGTSVAISGDTIVVGAPEEDSNSTGINGDQSNDSAAQSGAVYVFFRSSNGLNPPTWSQQAYLKASNTDSNDYFGSSVAISGDTIIVGAYGEDSNAAGVNGEQNDNTIYSSGAAYVFVRSGTIWSQQAYLKASNTDYGDTFGVSVAISGNTIVVGAESEDSASTGVNGDQTNNNALGSGSAYIFIRNGSIWSQQAYLKASNTYASTVANFGHSVAISGEVVAIGANSESSNATGINGNQNNNLAHNAGAAYIFVRNGTAWSQQGYLKASNTEAEDQFGVSVSVSADKLIVGAQTEDSNASGINGDQTNNSLGNSGAAYIFSGLGAMNASPTISTVAVARQAGSISANSLIANAGDTEDAKESLQIQISHDGTNFGNTATLNGVTVALTDSNAGATGINPNATGQVFADVVAACGASNASFTLKVTDSGGTFAQATLNVAVTPDSQPPSISCPANISATMASGQCSASVTYVTPTATDNCSGATASCVPTSGSTFQKGVTTVTCTARDAANNTAVCTFTVTVNDTQAPSITCPANVSVNTSAVGCFANVNYTAPTASDNCTASPTVTCTPAPGSSFSLGVTTVTCTATDASNNQSSPCSFTVTVRDSIAPIFGACPKNIYADTSAGACTATATYTAPTATDNCTTNPTVTCTPASGSSFELGVTTVTCSAKDAANNTSNACSFTVIVSDNVAPTLGACPANISANSTAGMCTAVVNYPLPTAMDNCTANPTVTCNPVPGATFIIGVTTVTCRATDSANNPSSSCSFTVTVKDTQPPVLACPANISVTATGGAGSAVVTYSTPIPTDNCMISEPFCVLTPTAIPPLVCSDTSGKGVTASCTPPSGANFPLGVTTVTCTASDSATPPNMATCNFTVTVTSCTSIVCPADIFTATATTTRVVNYLLPTANGSCGTITCTPAPGSTFNLGTTTVSCSSSVGNQTCAFRVTVNRIAASANDPLVCTGPGNTVQATLVISNNGTVNQTVSDTTTFTNLVGVPGSCTASPNVGACSVTNAGLTYNATLTPGQTVTLTYLTQVGNLAQSGAQVCTNNAVTFSGGPAFEFSVCDMIDCPAVGPGNPTTAGSALIYNVYTSSTDPAKQNTRINVTNSHPRLPAFVHLFFVAEGCSVADSYVCLTANQTTSFLASDLDPGTTGYLVAVAVDARGCPTDFNYLLGDEYVKFASGHAANLTAEAFAALAGGLPACDGNSVTAQLDFDGTSYSRLPAVLAASNVGSRADGNDTLLIVNRIGGNLGIGASTLGTLFGVFYDDAENALSFSVSGNCQLRNSISNNFPRTTPRFESFIPAGRTGWLKLSNQAGTVGITGATINFNANATAAAGAFNQGHNLHALTLNTTNSFVIPVFPPSC